MVCLGAKQTMANYGCRCRFHCLPFALGRRSPSRSRSRGRGRGDENKREKRGADSRDDSEREKNRERNRLEREKQRQTEGEKGRQARDVNNDRRERTGGRLERG